MTPRIASSLLPLARRLDPERAHRLALTALRLGLAGREHGRDDPALAMHAMGLFFSNPLGLAAGFDKDAVALRPLQRLGFGFVELGTVTMRRQAGNPRPRLFRLDEDRAVINRMGFNNGGIERFAARLATRAQTGGPVGANIGLNKDGGVAERDYPALLAATAAHADYVTINISSPNTPGLRDLQGPARLRSLLAAMAAAVPTRPPLLVKLAPDLSPGEIDGLVDVALEAGVDGLIVGNTTVSRPDSLRSAYRRETGGLSGRPLADLALRTLRLVARRAAGRLTLIGCGGIGTGDDVLARILAGASLVQLYTEFAYEGPMLIRRIKRELLQAMQSRGIASIAGAVGQETA